MRRRVAISGGTEEALQLIPALLANPEIEVVSLYDADPAALHARLAMLPPEIGEALEGRVTDDESELAGQPGLFAVIDAGVDSAFAARFPQALEAGIQVVQPLTARLLWCYRSGDRKAELLSALHEVVESYNLTVDTDELFRRMLEIAIGVTGADGGSVMLLHEEDQQLRVRVAVGVEPELWPKIRVAIGEGIAGRVVEEARPLCLRGKADRQTFRIVRERLDVESAVCVPLVHAGRILGVLNLHSTRRDAFGEHDLEFAEQLAGLDAQIIARAQEHAELREQAARYAAVREVRSALAARAPLAQRLERLCRIVVDDLGSGIANLYLADLQRDELRLAASSLDRSGLGDETRIPVGQGVDGAAARTRRPVFLRSAAGELAYAALPLLADDELVGVLALQAGPGTSGSPATEQSLLEVAEAAADEIAQIRRQERIEANATRSSAINEAGIRMLSVTDPAEVLREATSAAAMVLEAEHAVLRLQDEQSGRYAIRSYFGAADGHLQQQLFQLDKRLSVAVLKRRAPLRIARLADEPEFADLVAEVRSALAVPIRREGNVVGTLALYDKMAADRLSVSSFAGEDLELFSRFGAHVERALANAQFVWRARQFRNFDEETGLPNRAYLERRLQEELARAVARPGTLAVSSCRIDNLDQIQRARDGVFAARVAQRVAESLRRHLRDFDVAGRTGDADFTLLLPDPGFSPGERVSSLARGVAEDVSKDTALNDPVRIALAFGYALFPEDGDDMETLLERASEPRIRMV